MTATRALCCTLAAFALAIGGCKSADKEQPKAPATEQPKAAADSSASKPLTYQDSVNASVTAQVKSVDQNTRILTLRNAAGHEETFRVDPAVKRLDEVLPGDTVAVNYRATLLAELRAPTPAEAATPIAYVDVTGRAPRTKDPAAAAGQAVRIITTVEAVDVPNMLVTLRGPLGDLVVVKGREPENVKRLKRGDTIVITFTEVMAMALEKKMPS
jgi:hypothetical protein